MKEKLALCVWRSVYRAAGLIKYLLLKPCQMAEFVGWHFFSKWSLAARKGETMKWPNYGHGKAKEHSWLPALLFSPQVFLIACKRAASPFLLLACEWQNSVKETSCGSACSPSAFSPADIGMFNCMHFCCSLCSQPVWTLFCYWKAAQKTIGLIFCNFVPSWDKGRRKTENCCWIMVVAILLSTLFTYGYEYTKLKYWGFVAISLRVSVSSCFAKTNSRQCIISEGSFFS